MCLFMCVCVYSFVRALSILPQILDVGLGRDSSVGNQASAANGWRRGRFKKAYHNFQNANEITIKNCNFPSSSNKLVRVVLMKQHVKSAVAAHSLAPPSSNFPLSKLPEEVWYGGYLTRESSPKTILQLQEVNPMSSFPVQGEMHNLRPLPPQVLLQPFVDAFKKLESLAKLGCTHIQKCL